MKAVICTKYGAPEVLKLVEIEKPVPKDNEILIKISAVAIAVEDPLQRKGKPYFTRAFMGLTGPKKPILGTEFAGEIEEIGKGVNLFKEGDRVFGSTGFIFGCYAEYVCIPQDAFLSIIPPNLTNEEAAPVCASLTAWNFLVVQANIQQGQKVLISGASGSVGSAAVQIAREFGAEITGICSTPNIDLVKSLGAHSVIDYSKEDFAKKNGSYDIIFDVAGTSTFFKCKKILKENGIYLTTTPSLKILFQMFWTKRFSRRKALFSATGLQPLSNRLTNLKALVELFETGNLKIIIDRCYKLDEIVDAHRYVESGQKRGNVVITIKDE